MSENQYPLDAVIREMAEFHDAARDASDPESDSCALATVNDQGRPSVRTVSFHIDEAEGFVFFANSHSGKGAQLAESPAVAACVHWTAIRMQFVIEGDAEALNQEAADRIWSIRERDSQLAAHLSDQAETTESTLGSGRKALKSRFGFERLPRPEEWVGYAIQPARVAFWPSGWHRLKARKEYMRSAQGQFSLKLFEP